MGLPILDTKMVHGDELPTHRGTVVLAQPGAEKIHAIMKSDIGVVQEKKPRSFQHGIEWWVSDEMYLQDLTSQLECFMIWTKDPQWGSKDINFWGEQVGAIDFKTRERFLIPMWQTHAFRSSWSRQMTLEAMASNIGRMYGYMRQTGPNDEPKEEYLSMMTTYCLQAGLKAITKKYHSLKANIKARCKYMKFARQKKKKESEADRIEMLQDELDNAMCNGGMLMNLASNAIVKMMQYLKKTYNWDQIVPQQPRLDIAKEDPVLWETDGALSHWGNILKHTYEHDGNYWEEGDEWKVRSPCDPKIEAWLLGKEAEIASPPRRVGRRKKSRSPPPPVPSDLSEIKIEPELDIHSSDVTNLMEDDATVIEATPPPIIGPSGLAQTPQEIAAHLAVPDTNIVDDSSLDTHDLSTVIDDQEVGGF